MGIYNIYYFAGVRHFLCTANLCRKERIQLIDIEERVGVCDVSKFAVARFTVETKRNFLILQILLITYPIQ